MNDGGNLNMSSESLNTWITEYKVKTVYPLAGISWIKRPCDVSKVIHEMGMIIG